MVTSMPRERAASITVRVSTLLPQFGVPTILWCDTCVGTPACSPIAMVSLTLSITPAASWRMCEVCTPRNGATKSLLSALYGNYVRNGRIQLDKTLEQLGIDDDPPLTPDEKKATLRMVLQSRSGVYHTFVAGTP